MKSSLYNMYLVCLLFANPFTQQVIASDIDYSPYPQPDKGYVSDHANLLNVDEETRLERWLLQVEAKSNVEIVVVTIDALWVYEGASNTSIEAFATALFDIYGIGNRPKNDGVLLLISKDDRKARIELGKYYGRERDRDAVRIMQNVIVPQFKHEDYAVGITNGTEAIINEFAGMKVTFPWSIVGIVLAGLFSLLVGLSCIKNGKRGWGYVFIGVAVVLLLLVLFLGKNILSESSSSGGSSGFGGGSSGGGGATGSW